METTLIYFSVKAMSATYILYKVWMFIFSPRVYNFWDSQLRHMRIARIRLWKSRKKRMAEKARKARYRARLDKAEAWIAQAEKDILCLLYTSSLDDAVKFRFPFVRTVKERRVSQLLPLPVVEEFHPERIIIKKFPSFGEYSQVIDTYFHQFQTVMVDNLMESIHRCEIASFPHNSFVIIIPVSYTHLDVYKRQV